MGNWIDGLAKRSARTNAARSAVPPGVAVVTGEGMTRRQVIARGAVVTGVAWTAPALLAARPAFAGASICTDSNEPVYSICPDENGTEVCCPPGEECVYFPKQDRYDCDVPRGGICTNNGNGQCNGGVSRCNHTASTENERICGGPGTECIDGSSCVYDNCGDQVGQSRRCGGLNADCESNIECAPADPNNQIAHFCDFTKPSETATGTCQLVS